MKNKEFNTRIFLIVIDSFGIGAMPDAAEFGDEGSNTYIHILQSQPTLHLPTLAKLGLNAIDGVQEEIEKIAPKSLESAIYPHTSYMRLAEKAKAKDTLAGHYEIAGLSLERPYKIFTHFSKEILQKITEKIGYAFIGNKQASGTEIIQELGAEHAKTGKIIVYTSQDSVMQFAANEAIVPREELYKVCEVARACMVGENAVARIIARPFIYRNGRYERTKYRRDFALSPPKETVLDILEKKNIPVIAVGKINDIFNGKGITKSIASKGNAACLQSLQQLASTQDKGLIFVNLVDTDMLYGHRNDAIGYANALQEIDLFLENFIKTLKEQDILIVTADHGCDPTTPSTDHSREYVPCLIYGKRFSSHNLGTMIGFDCIANFMQAAFEIQADDVIYNRIKC